jgi:hypothetical protein
VQGIVIEVASPNFTVQNGNQNPVTIKTDANTRFLVVPMGKVQNYVNNKIAKEIKQDKKAGNPRQTRGSQMRELHIPANWKSNLGWLDTFDRKAKFSDLDKGDRVIIRAQSADNLAKQVVIIKAPVNRSIKGAISGFTATSVTITPSGNTTASTLNVTASTRIILKGITGMAVGQYATAVYNSKTMNASTVNVQATAPAVKPAPAAAAAAVNAIAIYPSPASVKIGNTLQLTANAAYSNGTTANMTPQTAWASSAPGIASVSPAGVVTGVAAGTCTITASLSGKSAAVTVTVVQ